MKVINNLGSILWFFANCNSFRFNETNKVCEYFPMEMERTVERSGGNENTNRKKQIYFDFVSDKTCKLCKVAFN